MSPSLPDMDKLKTQAESVHGTVKGTAIVSAMDGGLAVWRQDQMIGQNWLLLTALH